MSASESRRGPYSRTGLGPSARFRLPEVLLACRKKERRIPEDPRVWALLSLASLSTGEKTEARSRQVDVVSAFVGSPGSRRLFFSAIRGTSGEGGFRAGTEDEMPLTGRILTVAKLFPEAELSADHALDAVTWMSLETDPPEAHRAFHSLLRRVFLPALEGEKEEGNFNKSMVMYALRCLADSLLAAEESRRRFDVVGDLHFPPVSDRHRSSSNGFLAVWTRTAETLLAECDEIVRLSSSTDPASELLAWKRRWMNLVHLTHRIGRDDFRAHLLRSKASGSESFRVWRETERRIFRRLSEVELYVRHLETAIRRCPLPATFRLRTAMASISSVLESLAAVYRPSSERCGWQPASAFLVKYTNSLIRSCRKFLARNGIPNVLNQREEEWIEKIDSCLTLAREYRRYFREMKKSRGVFRDVSETSVFANLDNFCLLLEKIRKIPDMLRRYPGPFDREKREFREATSGLKNGVRRSYDTFDPDDAGFDADCADLLAAAEALKKPMARFRTVSFLAEAGDDPGRILRLYDRELDRMCRLFLEYRRKPPTLRGFSRIAERIAWTKRLSERIEEPFRRLPDFDHVLQGRQGKTVLEKYRYLAGQLERHAALLHRTWFQRFYRMEDFLKEPVLIQDPPDTAEVSVYYGSLWTFLAECVQISRMKLEIPEAGRILMSKEEELKRCRYVIQRALEEYAEIKRSVPEKLRPLTEPHLKRMEGLWLWGIRTLTWGSLTLESYARSCATSVGQLRLLLSRINSLLYDRIESMLGTLSDIQVLKFPTHRPLSPKELISVAEVTCRNSSESIQRLNVSIEDSVMELIDLCLEDLVSQIHNDRPAFPQMSSESSPFGRIPFPADDDFLRKTEREADLLLDSFAQRTKETVGGLLHRALESLRTMLTSHHSSGKSTAFVTDRLVLSPCFRSPVHINTFPMQNIGICKNNQSRCLLSSYVTTLIHPEEISCLSIPLQSENRPNVSSLSFESV
ncbi:dynein axonemal heavy chain 5-like [Centruroides vittatus]|uniref:dynein axonemal heavy chain 5-like n=1 Tax=Centruroides vittatus TaxID=120091 RepID=UPI0035102442